MLKETNIGPIERQQWILKYVVQNGSVTVDDLSERFQVSKMTIHRDLDELDRQGVLRKVRGGASVQPSYLFESGRHYRISQATREKEAIARHALTLIEPGQAIMLDDSTTTHALAQLLSRVKPLTVITNCLGTMSLISAESEMNLIALGGTYMPTFDCYAGLICENSIAALRANTLFMSVSAVAGSVAYHQNQEIIKVKQAMMKSSARKILMVDSGKFGRVALHYLAPLDQFDHVLVDQGLAPKYIAELQDARVKFELVPL